MRTRALIVEDDRSWQEILAEMLSDAGLAVDVASNLDEAVRLLRLQSHRLAVVDLSLGGRDHNNRDGLLVLQALRRHDPGCVALLLTGFATVELAVSSVTELGAFTCLRKETFRRDSFRDLLSKALASPPLAGSPGMKNDDALRVGPAGSAGISSSKASRSGESPAAAQKSAGLVVDDDAGWQSILAEVLADAGFETRLCSSYGEALGWLRREKFSIAVIDLSLASPISAARFWEENLPDRNLDGYRLLASTRAGGIPTIVVSGVATPSEIERAYAEQGIFAFIQKQVFNRRVFLETIADALKTARDSSALDSLTGREREVLDLLAQGRTNKEIADALVISTNTVKRHLKSIFEKLEIHTRAAAAAKAVSSK